MYIQTNTRILRILFSFLFALRGLFMRILFDERFLLLLLLVFSSQALLIKNSGHARFPYFLFFLFIRLSYNSYVYYYVSLSLVCNHFIPFCLLSVCMLFSSQFFPFISVFYAIVVFVASFSFLVILLFIAFALNLLYTI